MGGAVARDIWAKFGRTGVRCNALQVYISCWPLPLRLPVGSNASERPMDCKRLNVEMTGMGMMDLVGMV